MLTARRVSHLILPAARSRYSFYYSSNTNSQPPVTGAEEKKDEISQQEATSKQPSIEKEANWENARDITEDVVEILRKDARRRRFDAY